MLTCSLLFVGNYPSFNKVFMSSVTDEKRQNLMMSVFCSNTLILAPECWKCILRGPDFKIFPETHTFAGLSIRFEVGVCPYNSRRLWLFRWLKATCSRGVWGHASHRKFWNLEARKCDFKHSWREKVKLMMHTINPLIGRFLCVF